MLCQWDLLKALVCAAVDISPINRNIHPSSFFIYVMPNVVTPFLFGWWMADAVEEGALLLLECVIKLFITTMMASIKHPPPSNQATTGLVVMDCMSHSSQHFRFVCEQRGPLFN